MYLCSASACMCGRVSVNTKVNVVLCEPQYIIVAGEVHHTYIYMWKCSNIHLHTQSETRKVLQTLLDEDESFTGFFTDSEYDFSVIFMC